MGRPRSSCRPSTICPHRHLPRTARASSWPTWWPHRRHPRAAARADAAPRRLPPSSTAIDRSSRWPRSAGSTSTCMSTRASDAERAALIADRPHGGAARLQGPDQWPAIAARWRCQPDDFVDATIDACAEAGIAIVSLPMCNMYLQDRARRPHAALARRHPAARAQGARACRSRSPATIAATRSTPTATTTCWRSSPRRRASPISTIRSATGRRRHRACRPRSWASPAVGRIAGRRAGRPGAVRRARLQRAAVAPQVRPRRAARRQADRHDAARLSRARPADRA